MQIGPAQAVGDVIVPKRSEVYLIVHRVEKLRAVACEVEETGSLALMLLLVIVLVIEDARTEHDHEHEQELKLRTE